MKDYFSFSADGELLAAAGATGEVKIWQTINGALHLQMAPSKWSTILCLVWSVALQGSRKRKKRSSSVSRRLLAIGGSHGITMWDVGKNEEVQELSISGSNVVSLAWGGDSIFAADGTSRVIAWDTTTAEYTRWKVDKQGATCVSCNTQGDQLLTAGRSVKLWNTTDQTVIKKFSSGHTSNIYQLVWAGPSRFLSAAMQDRIINLMSTEGYRGQSLVCEAEVEHVDAMLASDQQIRVATVCSEGIVHFFTVDSSDDKDKEGPVLPITTIQLAGTSISDTPKPLPVLAAKVTDNSVLLAHTSTIKPVFESLEFHQEKRICLQREVPTGFLLPKRAEKTVGSSSHQAANNKAVTILGPGNMSLPQAREGEETPMSERLKALQISKKEKKPSQQKPTAESLSAMLIQAIQSGDKQLLERVLNIQKDHLITGTVKNLSMNTIVPFLRTLMEQLQTHPARSLELIVWLKAVLVSHTAYLMTVPHLLDSLSALYQTVDARVAMFGSLCKLQGKLDLLIAQVSSQSEDNGLLAARQFLNTPLLTITAGDDIPLTSADIHVSRESVFTEESDEDLFSSDENDEDMQNDEDNQTSEGDEEEEDEEEEDMDIQT